MRLPGGCNPAATRIADVHTDAPPEGWKFASRSNCSTGMSSAATPKPCKCEDTGMHSASQGLAKEHSLAHSVAKAGQYGEAIAVHALPPGPWPLRIWWGFVQTHVRARFMICQKFAARPVGFFQGAPNQHTSIYALASQYFCMKAATGG